MHLGEDDYPDYVIKYFNQFFEFVGIGNPTNPISQQKLLYGAMTAPQVVEYIRVRNINVKANVDKSSIIYWWSQAGLSEQALIFECLHNIAAFTLFTNILYSIIYVTIHPNNPLDPVNLPPYPNFFTEYNSVSSSEDKLNVIREAYRLLVPNSGSLSRITLASSDPNSNIRSIHAHQEIMILNQPLPPGISPFGPTGQAIQNFEYFTYNPNQYTEAGCTGSLSDASLIGLPLVTDILLASATSPLDQETVVDTSTTPQRHLVPIFPTPIYCPFGLGYRRCAGEMLNYLITGKLLAKFSGVTFEDKLPLPTPVYPDPAGNPYIPISPFKQVPDSIYVKQL